MITPVFGFLDSAKEAMTEFVNNCLLVAGGFLIGYILGGIVGWALGKWVFRQKTPDTLKQLGRPIGGVILALIIALIVFTGKGRQPGDGGDGKGSPSTDSAQKNSQPKTEPDPKVDPNVIPKKIDLKPADVTLRVTIIAGGAVPAEGKFYLLDDDRTPKTLAELKRAIEERKAKEKGKMTLAILFPTDRNIAPSDRKESKVTDVTRWATEEAGLDVMFPASK